MSNLFNEKNFSLKMEKSIISFKKDISLLEQVEQIQTCWIQLKLMFMDKNAY